VLQFYFAINIDASGVPDGWSGKGSIWLLPGVTVGLYVLLTVLSKFPHAFNYLWAITEENAERQYIIARTMVRSLKAELIILFTYMEYATVQTAMGEINGLGIIFVPITLVVIFGTIAMFLIQGYKAK
jgi:hypothetical protein